MNITLSADKDVIEKARAYVRKHGTSLNHLIREHLLNLTGELTREEAAEEFAAVARSMPGDSTKTERFSRHDLYANRLDAIARPRSR